MNEKSIHQQFKSISCFKNAFKQLMDMRKIAKDNNYEISCNRELWNTKPLSNIDLKTAISHFDHNSKKYALNWISKSGPFWDDDRQHNANVKIICNGNDVTNTAIGESGYRIYKNQKCSLISVKPSNWDNTSIIKVNYLKNEIKIKNFFDKNTFENKITSIIPPFNSWKDLQLTSISQFKHLVFSINCFKPLLHTPFVKSSANKIYFLLNLLDQLLKHTDINCGRNQKGQEIYDDYFKGKKPSFSNSSKTEINNFKNELTFSNPKFPDEDILCSWHGKVFHQILRIHFSWPMNNKKNVYVVYIGPKLTQT